MASVHHKFKSLHDRSRRGPDFDRINGAARGRLEELCAQWLPEGKRRGREWVSRNPCRHDERAGSFSVNLQTGRWADFAIDAKGGDPISLAAYLSGLSQAEAARRLAHMLGLPEHG